MLYRVALKPHDTTAGVHKFQAHPFSRKTKFYSLGSNVCGFSARNFTHDILIAPRNWRRFLDFFRKRLEPYTEGNIFDIEWQ